MLQLFFRTSKCTQFLDMSNSPIIGNSDLCSVYVPTRMGDRSIGGFPEGVLRDPFWSTLCGDDLGQARTCLLYTSDAADE